MPDVMRIEITSKTKCVCDIVFISQISFSFKCSEKWTCIDEMNPNKMKLSYMYQTKAQGSF